MNEWGLPGLQARFEFLSAAEQVELKLDLRFDPAQARLTRAGRRGWLELRDRLAGGPDNRLPPSLTLVTSLASAPLAATSDGQELRSQFVDFLSQLEALSDDSDLPVASALVFSLPRAGAADLPGDIFKLEVRLEIWPVPIAVAEPRVEAGDKTAFASAFENCWRGFDGGGGRLALASEVSEDEGLWCVRVSAEQGIALSSPAIGRAHFAVAPLSTLPLYGRVQGEGESMAMQAIDLDRWWNDFAANLEAMEAAASGRLGDRFERLRAALAAGLASRLLPVVRAPDPSGVAEAHVVCEAALQSRLSRRPLVESAKVEVSRGRRRSDEPETRLWGRASTWTGTAYGASPSLAGMQLEEGPQWLAYALRQDFGSETARALHFKGDRIDRQGYPKLRFLLDSDESDAFALSLTPRPAIEPLIAVPQQPSLSVACVRAGGDAATLEAALSWSVNVQIAASESRLDRLELAFEFGREGEPIPARTGNAEGALFEALGKAFLFARSTPVDSDPDLDRIERFAGIAEGVAEALATWSEPMANVDPLPGRWRYAVDFRDLPALIVEREGPDCPWPALDGFAAAGTPDGDSLRFEPKAESKSGPAAAGSLRLSLAGPKLMGDRQVRVHGRTVRNANLADNVEPAFVYHGGSVSVSCAAPSAEWQSPDPEPNEASLEATIASVLGRIDETSGDPYRLGMEAVLIRRLEAGGGESFETRFPLLLLPNISVGGEGDGAIGELGREIARALATARAMVDPGRGVEPMALTITLHDREPEPLARLEFMILGSADPAWWGPD
jgi:hypothetical protein